MWYPDSDVYRSQTSGSHGMQRICSQILNRTILFYFMFIFLNHWNGGLHIQSAVATTRWNQKYPLVLSLLWPRMNCLITNRETKILNAKKQTDMMMPNFWTVVYLHHLDTWVTGSLRVTLYTHLQSLITLLGRSAHQLVFANMKYQPIICQQLN